MNKDRYSVQELVNQLVHTRHNYILGLAGYALLNNERTYSFLSSQSAVFGPYSVSFDQVTRLFRDQRDQQLAMREFLKMLMRTLIKESFEHIKDYCTRTEQFGSLKSQSWYEFARIIRNFLSHNCRFQFNKYDLERLPVNWNGKVITGEMNGQIADFSFFGQVETWELFAEMEDFVRSQLK